MEPCVVAGAYPSVASDLLNALTTSHRCCPMPDVVVLLGMLVAVMDAAAPRLGSGAVLAMLAAAVAAV